VFALKITGKIEGSNISRVYLGYYYTFRGIPICTAMVKDNKFVLDVPKAYSKGIFALGTMVDLDKPVSYDNGYLVLEDKDVAVTIVANASAMHRLKAPASLATIQFNTYDSTIDARVKAKNQLIAIANKRIQSAVDQEESQTLYGLWINKLDSVQKYNIGWLRAYGAANKNTVAGKVASSLAGPLESTKAEYFSKEDFEDMYLASQAALDRKIMFSYQNESMSKEITPHEFILDLVRKAPAKAKSREAIYNIGFRLFGEQIEELRPILVAYAAEFPNDSWAKEKVALLPKASPSVGEIAPDIMLKGVSGDTIKLSSLRGKVVLLDFWASWCGPCRQENPNVVRAYDKYVDKGFTVFSVSLDQDGEKWKQAIAKDNLKWSNHVSDLKGWSSSGASLYGVRSIPATFLLDKTGKIIAKNLRGEQLDEALKKLLE